MTIDLNVLNHLGIGLYSSTPAVLSEVVANSWDADANIVEIEIRPAEKTIAITDDGIGMTSTDLNNKYLRIGYRKRVEDGATTPKGRHVMGRKGIGKLSVFSIAEMIEVHTVRNGTRSGLIMRRSEIQDLMAQGGSVNYKPRPIPPGQITLEKGTRVVLRNLDKDIATTAPFLRRRLARRFSVIGEQNGFTITVNDDPITPKDRDFYQNLEFLWHLGAENPEIKDHAPLLEAEIIGGRTAAGHEVRGWIGTVDRPERIDKNNNAIVVLSRGKLVHENLLPYFNEPGIYADYVIGEINADFLDADDQDDIVTSGRQSLKEDDERFKQLLEFVGEVLKTVKRKWTTLRREHGTRRALENPVLREWYGNWSGDLKRSAEKMFGRIESLPIAHSGSKEELYKATLIAFERLAIRDSLSIFDSLETEGEFATLSRLLGTVDELEAAHYFEIITGRLRVIERFKNLAPEAKERVLQQYLFDHIWLLDASWERAATKPHIEEAVTKDFAEVTGKLSPEERRGRLDLRYRSAAGKHIIIELKKYGVGVSAARLAEQVQKYRSALLKCLRERFPNEPTDVEAICILGREPTPRDQPTENRDLLRAVGARWYTYDQLIDDALSSYAEYLQSQNKIHRLLQLIDRLSGTFDVATA